MSDALLVDSSLRWALALALIFPLLVVTLGEFSHAFESRGNPFAQPLQALRNLVIPSLIVLLLLSQVLGYDSTTIAWRIGATVFWILLIHASLSLLKAIVFAGARASSWRAHVPPLLLDMIRYFLVMVGAAFVLSSVWAIDLRGLLAAVGVGSLVVGLALQETLGNMFAGIALMFENPVRIGDWVEIEGKTGRVVGFNARAVNLENADRELIVIPNRTFGQQRFRNLSYTGTFGHCLNFGFSYNDPPNSVKALLTLVARETRGVLPEPAPFIRLLSYEEQQVRYQIRLFIGDYGKLAKTSDEFATRLWYAARRHGLTMRAEVEPGPLESPTEDELLKKLQSIPMLASVQRQVLQSLAGGIEIQHFGKGERIIRQGEPGKALYIVLAGQAVVTTTTNDGITREMARLRRGEYFGELALLSSEISHASVTATEDLEVIAIHPGPARAIVDSNPQLARELNATMARRSRESEDGERY